MNKGYISGILILLILLVPSVGASFTVAYQSDSVYQVLVEAINYSYWGTKFEDNSTIKKVDGYAFYRFPNGQIHDLLAVIIPSQSNTPQDSNMNTSSTGIQYCGEYYL